MNDNSKFTETCAEIQRRHTAILQDEDRIYEIAKNGRILMARMQETFDNVAGLNVTGLIGEINERREVISNQCYLRIIKIFQCWLNHSNRTPGPIA